MKKGNCQYLFLISSESRYLARNTDAEAFAL